VSSWLGIDLGTQGVRAVLFDDEGRVLGTGSSVTLPRSPYPGWMTHRPDEDWFGGSVASVRQAVGDRGASVSAIGLTSTFPTFCLVDRSGSAIGEAVLYSDTRATSDIAEAAARLGVTLTGDEVSPRLFWFASRRPEDLARADMVLGPAGYLGRRLTGNGSVDPVSAYRWGGLLDERRASWLPAAARAVGVRPETLPRISAPDEVIGTVTGNAARLTGLVEGTPVVAGLPDTMATLIGHGVTETGDAMAYYGSSGTLLICTVDLQRALRDPSVIGPGRPWELAAYGLNSGVFAESIRRGWLGDAPYDDLDQAAGAVPPGANGLMVLPHVAGRLVPEAEPNRRAAILGVTTEHGRGEVWRAVLESFGYLLMEAQRRSTMRIRILGAAGGGANSAVWRQIVSDMTGLVQHRVQGPGAARGAAFIAGLGMGRFRHLAEIRPWLTLDAANRTEPDEEVTLRYRALYDVWQRLDRGLGGLSSADLPV
jgi:xylulokinase